MANKITRTIERYLIPQFVAALFYTLRDRCYVSTQARVQFTPLIRFGKGTVVKPFAILQTRTGRIITGRECAIGSFNHFSTGTEDIILGDYVRIGPHVTIIAGSHNFKDRNRLIIEQGSHHKCVTIGSDVMIGAGSTILPGCQIGNGAVIGAMSLVNKDIPAYAIVAGVPAKVIGQRE